MNLKNYFLVPLLCLATSLIHTDPKITQLLVEQVHENKDQVHLFAIKSDQNLYDTVMDKSKIISISDFEKITVVLAPENKKNESFYYESELQEVDGRITCIGQPIDIPYLISDTKWADRRFMPVVMQKKVIGKMFSGLVKDILCVITYDSETPILQGKRPNNKEIELPAVTEGKNDESTKFIIKEIAEGHTSSTKKIALVQDIFFRETETNAVGGGEDMYKEPVKQGGWYLLSATDTPTMRLTKLFSKDHTVQLNPFKTKWFMNYRNRNEPVLDVIRTKNSVLINKDENIIISKNKSYVCRGKIEKEKGSNFWRTLFNKNRIFSQLIFSNDEKEEIVDLQDSPALPYLPTVFFDPALFLENDYQDIIKNSFVTTLKNINVSVADRSTLYISKTYAVIVYEGKFKKIAFKVNYLTFNENGTSQFKGVEETHTKDQVKITASAFDFTEKTLYLALYNKQKTVVMKQIDLKEIKK